MEDFWLIASIGAAIFLLILMFVVSKFLIREQSYDKVLEQKKNEQENANLEQKPGKQRRRHVYSKHTDKQKFAEDKSKSADEKPKVMDQKQKHGDSKQKLSGERQQLSDEKQKSPTHKASPAKKLDAELTPKKHVEIIPKVEAIEPDMDLPSHTAATPEKSLSSHPSRSILVNRDEKSLIIEAEFVPETFHPRPAPVDELDRKQQDEARRVSGTLQISRDEVEQLREKSEQWITSTPSGKLNQKKKKKSKASEPAEDVEGKPVNLEVMQTNPVEPTSGPGKLSKKDVKDVKELISAAVSMVERNECEDSDCRRLIKALEDCGFSLPGKSDGIRENDFDAELLKRQIKYLEMEKQKDKSTLASADAQIKHLQEELGIERQKCANQTKTNHAFSAKQNQEIIELRNQLELLSKKKDQEWQQYKSHLESLQSDNVNSLKALVEENECLKEISRKLEQQLLEKPNVFQLDDNNDASQQHLEDNIKQFENHFEEMVAKQEMEKLKEENENLVHSLRSDIEKLKAEIVEKEKRTETKQTDLQCNMTELMSDLSSNGLIDKCSEQHLLSQRSSQEAMIKELQEQLHIQKQKNDVLRQRNWRAMESLSELEKELQNSCATRAELVVVGNGDLGSQLKFVQQERENLLKLKEEQLSTISTMQCQIVDLKKEIGKRHQWREMPPVVGKDAGIIKLEESLNRQIQKNDDLRRRNWKTMEALAEMEKRVESSLLLKSRLEEMNEVSDLKEQLRLLQKEKQDFAQLKAADKLNESQQQQHINKLEASVAEKNAQIKQLEDKLLSAEKTVGREVSEAVLPVPDGTVVQPNSDEKQYSCVTGSPARSAVGDDVNRKEVMVVTRIQETAKWDLSQLVLELDTKTAEVEILQSLLDHNEKTLHDLQDEKSKNLESLHHMRQALKEHELTIGKLKSQLMISSGSEGHQFESESIGNLLAKKDAEIEELKTELLQYQSKIKNLETCNRRSLSPGMLREPISEDEREMFDASLDGQLKMSKDESVALEIKALQDQVKHYQNVLADTVGMLGKLQSSIEQEESKWQHKIEAADAKATEAHHEAEQLRFELEMLKRLS